MSRATVVGSSCLYGQAGRVGAVLTVLQQQMDAGDMAGPGSVVQGGVAAAACIMHRRNHCKAAVVACVRICKLCMPRGWQVDVGMDDTSCTGPLVAANTSHAFHGDCVLQTHEAACQHVCSDTGQLWAAAAAAGSCGPTCPAIAVHSGRLPLQECFKLVYGACLRMAARTAAELQLV
jgi:hypothetical protein